MNKILILSYKMNECDYSLYFDLWSIKNKLKIKWVNKEAVRWFRVVFPTQK